MRVASVSAMNVALLDECARVGNVAGKAPLPGRLSRSGIWRPLPLLQVLLLLRVFLLQLLRLLLVALLNLLFFRIVYVLLCHLLVFSILLLL